MARDAHAWNCASWRAGFEDALGDAWIFAEDVFGDQYALRRRETDEDEILKMTCEGGDVEVLPFSTPAAFLEVAVTNPALILDVELARSVKQSSLWPGLREHLGFVLPLVCGGAYALESLEVIDGEVHLDVLGQMRAQMAGVEDGTPIAGFEES